MGTLTVTSPATGEVLGTVDTIDLEDARSALVRARAAQERWAATPIRERARVITRFRDLLLDHADEVCQLLSQENGKMLQESLEMEVFPIADLASYFASRAHKILEPRDIPLHLLKYRRSYLHYRPRGVVFVIAPWNFPLAIPFGTVIMALLAGNAVLLKPASLTPLIALKGRALMLEAGIDPDLFQVLPCPGAVASEIIDLGVDYVNFTGSTTVGKHVAARCGQALVPCSMELGGKDPAIVLPDANLEYTVNALVWGAFANAGQVCASVERVYVHESIYDEVVERVVKRVEELRVGDPLGGEFDMGPMTDPGQLAIVQKQVEASVAAGATVRTGGTRIDGPGQFFAPTVLTDVDESMPCLAEETFGPTLPLLKYKTEAEAIRRANDSVFGLDAYVFTTDRARGRAIAEQLEAGTVMVNEVLFTHALPETPWGGVKESGIGRVHSDDGLRDLCECTHINEERVVLPLQSSPFWHPYSDEMYQRILGAARLVLRKGVRQRVRGLCSIVSGSGPVARA